MAVNYSTLVEIPEYTVFINSSIEHGSVVSNKVNNILAGDTVTLTAILDTGYVLDNITITDTSSKPVAMESYNRFKMPESDIFVDAVFKEISHVLYKVNFDSID